MLVRIFLNITLKCLFNVDLHPQIMKPKITIIFAEDKALVRKSFIALLKEYKEFEVVGEAGNGKELLELLRKINTDIVLLDIKMPVMNGIDALKLVRARYPYIKVIMLSSQSDLISVKTAIACGARGFLSKDCSPEQLAKTILNIAEKGFYLEEEISNELLNDSLNGAAISTKKELSGRELEILKEFCNGLTEKEIADKLHISAHTVHFHKKNLYAKTNTHNIAGLLKFNGEMDSAFKIEFSEKSRT